MEIGQSNIGDTVKLKYSNAIYIIKEIDIELNIVWVLTNDGFTKAIMSWTPVEMHNAY